MTMVRAIQIFNATGHLNKAWSDGGGYAFGCVPGGGRSQDIRIPLTAALLKAQELERGMKSPDPINSPPHYAAGGIEVIDALEAWGLDGDFCLGNVVKYVARAGKKDPAKLAEDLKKARWYLGRRINRLESNA